MEPGRGLELPDPRGLADCVRVARALTVSRPLSAPDAEGIEVEEFVPHHVPPGVKLPVSDPLPDTLRDLVARGEAELEPDTQGEAELDGDFVFVGVAEMEAVPVVLEEAAREGREEEVKEGEGVPDLLKAASVREGGGE